MLRGIDCETVGGTTRDRQIYLVDNLQIRRIDLEQFSCTGRRQEKWIHIISIRQDLGSHVDESIVVLVVPYVMAKFRDEFSSMARTR